MKGRVLKSEKKIKHNFWWETGIQDIMDFGTLKQCKYTSILSSSVLETGIGVLSSTVPQGRYFFPILKREFSSKYYVKRRTT